MKQVVPGFDERTGPSIALPEKEHLVIPKLQGTYKGSARSILARDIANLRKFTQAPNEPLRELIHLNKQMYPQSFQK